MTRGIGVAEWLSELPEIVVVLAAVLTQLGDLWFLTLTVGTLYWLGPHTPRLGDAVDRERMVIVLGLLLLAIALTETLKAIFALPRPPWFVTSPTLDGVPAALARGYAWFAGASGYGFPSGHAIAVTMGWGGLAWAVRTGSRRRRYATAGTVIGVVGIARLVLGVHYLVDVLVGIAIALATLALVLGSRRWLGSTARGGLRSTPAIVFGLAIIVGWLGVAITELTTDAAGALGLPIGAAAGWIYAGHDATSVAGAGVARITALLGVLLVLPPVAVAVAGPVQPVVTLVVATVAGAALIVLPLVGERLEEKVAS